MNTIGGWLVDWASKVMTVNISIYVFMYICMRMYGARICLSSRRVVAELVAGGLVRPACRAELLDHIFLGQLLRNCHLMGRNKITVCMYVSKYVFLYYVCMYVYVFSKLLYNVSILSVPVN